MDSNPDYTLIVELIYCIAHQINTVFFIQMCYFLYYNFPTVKLILDDVVEDLEEVEDEVVVGRLGKEEPLGGEGLHQVHQPRTRHHRQTLQVGGDWGCVCMEVWDQECGNMRGKKRKFNAYL